MSPPRAETRDHFDPGASSRPEEGKLDAARAYPGDRIVFKRPIGQNQGVPFPIARAHVNIEAADLMRVRAAELFDAGEPYGAEANMANVAV